MVEFGCLVHDVAQAETALHEDKPRRRAGLPERRQLDVPRRYEAIIRQRYVSRIHVHCSNPGSPLKNTRIYVS
ncbi:MAG: hypothetical protein ACK53Y_01880 [bacterium]